LQINQIEQDVFGATSPRNRMQISELNMASDDISNRLEKAAEALQSDAHRRALETAEARKKQFNKGWASATASLVIPTLNAIGDQYLKPRAISFRVSKGVNGTVTLQAYKGNEGVDILTPPTLTFSPHDNVLAIYASFEAANDRRGSKQLTLETLTENAIKTCVAEFLEALTTGPQFMTRRA
jgi:hypothetical protein